MKKILQNVYFDYCLKAVLGGLLIWFIALQIEIRDFVKYVQPQKDYMQDMTLITLSDHQRGITEQADEQNSNTNKRIDQNADKINVSDKKLDLILFKLDMIEAKDVTSYNQN